MPYKSQAQMRKMHALAKAGKIPTKVIREWDKASEGLTLPKRKKTSRRDVAKMMHYS